MADPMFIVDSKNMEYEVLQKVGQGAYEEQEKRKEEKERNIKKQCMSREQ